MAIRPYIQSLVSDASLGAPDAVDTVAAQHSNRISASRCSCCQAEFPLVPLRNAVRKFIFLAGFDFTRVLQDQGIRTVFVKRSTPFDSL
jgi:hypothetical protein